MAHERPKFGLRDQSSHTKALKGTKSDKTQDDNNDYAPESAPDLLFFGMGRGTVRLIPVDAHVLR